MAKRTSALILTASLAVGFAGTSLAADSSGAIERALQTVPTVSGLSAYGRIETCGIQIRQSSFTRFNPDAFPSRAIKPGDGVLVAVLILPSIPGTAAATEDADLYRTVVSRWLIWQGKVLAQNGWAQRIQYRPRPLDWMNC